MFVIRAFQETQTNMLTNLIKCLDDSLKSKDVFLYRTFK